MHPEVEQHMPSEVIFALFDTAMGVCAVAQGEAGLVGVWLPEADEAALRGRILRRFGEAGEVEPSGSMGEAVARIQSLLATGEADLDPIALDFSPIDDFDRAVYAVARRIGPGRTLTYGEIARQVGQLSDARRVGQALGRNRWPIVVPCHRVLGADGKAGGFSAPGAVDTKIRMLNLERARVGAEPRLFDALPLAVRPR
jgi:methylated-DNA-[protein]-cysteine S-methyltransferase